ncbi:MAG TPA: cupin domain-containing protein [Gaiellaceae bacterium]|jgi:quercetin dioxygenase-like cupin family protein
MKSGDAVENPVTGVRVVWRKTSAETGGLAVVAEVLLPPNGHVPFLHVHPRQQERLEVLAGSVGVRVGRGRSVVGPGARIVVPVGTPHRYWNAGDEPAHLVVELTPALRYEAFVATLCALAAAGEAEGRRRTPALRLAALAADHFDTVRLAFPPAAVQRLVLAAVAPLARRSRDRRA